MSATRRISKDEYAVFETLKAKGVAVLPFATAVSEVGAVGIPAVVVGRNASGAYMRKMIVSYGDVIPVVSYALRAFPRFFMQKHMMGHEVVCGVMQDGKKILPLVPVDTIPRSLHESGAWHIAPAVQDAIQILARDTHKALGVKGHSCVRLVVNGTTPYVTGVDVAPPLTRTGSFMRSALLAGFTADEINESTH